MLAAYAYVCIWRVCDTHHFLIDRNKLVSCQEKGSGQSCIWMGRHPQKLPTSAMAVWPNACKFHQFPFKTDTPWLDCWFQAPGWWFTPLKTNMSLEKCWLDDYFPLRVIELVCSLVVSLSSRKRWCGDHWTGPFSVSRKESTWLPYRVVVLCHGASAFGLPSLREGWLNGSLDRCEVKNGCHSLQNGWNHGFYLYFLVGI